jgi:hypothetical protein
VPRTRAGRRHRDDHDFAGASVSLHVGSLTDPVAPPSKIFGGSKLFRSTTGADLDRVLACTITEPISWIPADRYRAELADRQYRPEWTWIAEDSGQILARALWWGLPGSAHPLALDCVYVHDSVSDRIGLAAAKGGPPDHRHHRHDQPADGRRFRTRRLPQLRGPPHPLGPR